MGGTSMGACRLNIAAIRFSEHDKQDAHFFFSFFEFLFEILPAMYGAVEIALGRRVRGGKSRDEMRLLLLFARVQLTRWVGSC